MIPRPPRLARWLLRHLAPAKFRHLVADDLDEAFAARAATDERGARRWYLRQAALSTLVLLIPRRVGGPITLHPIGRMSMSIQQFVQDLRYGARTLRFNPMFTFAGIGTLALGIGGTVALFSVVRSVLLAPPAYESPETVVNLFETREQQPGRLSNMSYPDVMDVRDRTRTLSGVAARQSWSPTLLGEGDPVRLRGGSVSASFFNLLGVRPVVGRLFDEGDGVPGHAPVVVLSERLWTETFGSDPRVVGRTVQLSGNDYEVVGIVPAGFEDTDGPNVVWRADPTFFDVTQLSRTGHSFRPTARIADGFTLDDVNAELAQITADLVREYPEKNGDGMVAVPAMDVLVGESRTAIVLLFAAVSLMLVVAAANVANLLLSRATGRRREIAVRTALGASPGRLTSQLMAESLVLAVLGGGAGILLARAVVPAFVSMTSAIPRAERISVDPVVMLFAVAVMLVVGVCFGLAPTWLARRQPVGAYLRDGQRTLDSTGGRTLKDALVVGELALALVLLTGAGLLVRSFMNLQQVDRGVRTENVLTLSVSPSGANWPDHGDLTRYWEQVVENVEAISGVRSAGAVSFLPLSGGYEGQGIWRADRARPEPGQAFSAEARAVTPEYFRTMGISVLRGRAFSVADDSAGSAVIAINQTLAQQLYPGEDPLGKSIMVRDTPHEIVGIVGDTRQFGVEAPVRPEVYAPHAQPFVPWIRGSMDLVVYTEVDPLSVADAVRRAVWSVDASAPIARIKSMQRWADEDVSGPRFRTAVLTTFATVSLLLALVGIAGVLSYAVGRRTREFGLRAALGATRGDIVMMVLAQGARLIGTGVALGLGLSLGAARFLRSVLFGVGSADPVTVALVTVGVVLVSFAAMASPAMRAASVSPTEAMRAD